MAVTQDNVIPLHDRIVVRADEEEKVSHGGILIAPHIHAKFGMLGTTFGGNPLASIVSAVFSNTVVIPF